jgi:hypothetical protein
VGIEVWGVLGVDAATVPEGSVIFADGDGTVVVHPDSITTHRRKAIIRFKMFTSFV